MTPAAIIHLDTFAMKDGRSSSLAQVTALLSYFRAGKTHSHAGKHFNDE